MKRTGIYAGTFDPVHDGHIAFALAAARAAKLDRVIFIPEPQPRFKTKVSNLKHRLTMLKLATARQPLLEVAELPNAQFDVARTLPYLQDKYGSLTLLLGSDVAKAIASWPDYERLFAQTELVVALRSGADAQKIQSDLAAAGAKFLCMQSPNRGASSSQVRIGNSGYLSVAVAAYITENGLYALAPTTN